MYTIAYCIWNFGIDKEIRQVDSVERSKAFIDAAKDLFPGQAYRMLQRVRTYFMTPHNGKPLTELQKNTMMKYYSEVKNLIF